MLLSYRDIAKHQALVPWKRERQVEQDLLLCLAMQAIFTDGFLSGQVAMRGGTLLGTKMRALLQRRRGRDLFDLYGALEHLHDTLNPERVMECFLFYLQKEGGAAGRQEFLEILDGHLVDKGFCSDMEALLRSGVAYDPQLAGRVVKARLLAILP